VIVETEPSKPSNFPVLPYIYVFIYFLFLLEFKNFDGFIGIPILTH